MKLLRDIAKTFIDTSGDKIVTLRSTHLGYVPIEPAQRAQDVECEFCGCREFAIYTNEKLEHVWMCANVCPLSILPPEQPEIVTTGKHSRKHWLNFCQRNNLGDKHHDVCFEKIEQSPGIMAFLRNFAMKPSGLILMHGDTGRGKTYSAMALCEYFLRTHISAAFMTNYELNEKWLEGIRMGGTYHLRHHIENVEFLIIDDFGTAAPTDKFLEFLMDVINTRLQWQSKITIFTTNLKPMSIAKFAGEALTDRIFTGHQLIFNGKSRRAAPIT